MINFFNNLIILVYNRVKNLYIYYFKCSVAFFENIVILLYGEEFLEYLWERWGFTVFFYTNLWYLVRKILYDNFENLKLVVIWKIKRSSNFFVKALNKYLTRYDWFNNNLIKF